MGVDCRLSLPGNVRVRDVASVLGILLGLPFSLDVLDGDSVWCKVPGANVTGLAEIPEMARIDLKRPDGSHVAGFFYHFENPGGRRLIFGRATATVIATFVRVADFFGGSVDFLDCDDEDSDYSAHDRPDEENHPEDGEPWRAFQRRMAEVKPLTAADLKAYKSIAAY